MKMKRCFNRSTCGYYVGSMYYSGVPLYERVRDGTYYIIKDGKRVDVGIINCHGTVVLLPKGEKT